MPWDLEPEEARRERGNAIEPTLPAPEIVRLGRSRQLGYVARSDAVVGHAFVWNPVVLLGEEREGGPATIGRDAARELLAYQLRGKVSAGDYALIDFARHRFVYVDGKTIPPCTYSLCIRLRKYTNYVDGPVSVNFQGPGGENVTNTVTLAAGPFATATTCIPVESDGTWRVTATFPDGRVAAMDVDMPACTTRTLDLPYVLVSVSCPEGRSVTVTHPDGSTVWSGALPTGASGILVPTSIVGRSIGDVWTVSGASPVDAGAGVTYTNAVLSALSGGWYFSPDGGVQDVPLPDYIWAILNYCPCRTMPRVLDYSDPYGTCQLIYSSGIWRGVLNFTADNAIIANCPYSRCMKKLGTGATAALIEVAPMGDVFKTFAVTKRFLVEAASPTCSLSTVVQGILPWSDSYDTLCATPYCVEGYFRLNCTPLPTMNYSGSYTRGRSLRSACNSLAELPVNQPPNIWGAWNILGS